MTNDGNYHQCSAGNYNIWYNKKLKNIIYSKDSITIPTSDLSSKSEWLKGIFSDLINKLDQAITPDASFKKVKKFRNLYLNQKSSKFIAGTFEDGESGYYKSILVEYDSFNTDVCSIVDTYDQYNPSDYAGILCSNEGNNYYVLAQGTDMTIDPKNIWPDLTSKLRVS